MALNKYHETLLADMQFEGIYDTETILKNHVMKELKRLDATKHLNNSKRSNLAEPIWKLALEKNRTKVKKEPKETEAGPSSTGEDLETLGFVVPSDIPADDAVQIYEVDEGGPSTEDTTFGRFVTDKVLRTAENLGLATDIFIAYGPPLQDNQIIPWDHPVPCIGVTWATRTLIDRQSDMKAYAARLSLNDIYNLLGFRQQKPHPGAPDDHPKGMTCFFCNGTFFDNQIVTHFQQIFEDFDAGRPVELEPHVSKDKINSLRTTLGATSLEDARFGYIVDFITATVLEKYESGQSVVQEFLRRPEPEDLKLVQDVSKLWYSIIARQHFSMVSFKDPGALTHAWNQNFKDSRFRYSPRLGSQMAICTETVATAVRQLLKSLCDSLESYDTVVSATPVFIDAHVDLPIDPVVPLSFPKAEYAGLTAIYIVTAQHRRFIVPIQIVKLGPRMLQNTPYLSKSAGWFHPSTIEKLQQKFDQAHIIVAKDSEMITSNDITGVYRSRRYSPVWHVGPYAKVRQTATIVKSAQIFNFTRNKTAHDSGPGAPWIWMARSIEFILNICTFKGNEVNWRNRAEPSEFDVVKLDDVEYFPNPGTELLNFRTNSAAAMRRVVRHYLFQKPELQRDTTPEQFNARIFRRCKTEGIKGEDSLCAGSYGKDGHIPCPASMSLNARTAYLHIIKEDAQAVVPLSCAPCSEFLMPFTSQTDFVIGEDVDGKPSCVAFHECPLPQEAQTLRCLYHQEWDQAPIQPALLKKRTNPSTPPQPLHTYIRPTANLSPDESNSLSWLRGALERKDPKVLILDFEFFTVISGRVLPFELSIRNLRNEVVLRTMINYKKTLYEVIEDNRKYLRRHGEPSDATVARARGIIQKRYRVSLSTVTPGMTARQIADTLITWGFDKDTVVLTYGFGEFDATMLNSLLFSVKIDIPFLTNSLSANLLILLKRLVHGTDSYRLSEVHRCLCQDLQRRQWHNADEDVAGMIEIMDRLFKLLAEVKPAGLP